MATNEKNADEQSQLSEDLWASLRSDVDADPDDAKREAELEEVLRRSRVVGSSESVTG